MEGLRYFEEIASRLDNEEIRAWKQSGKRVVGTVCANIPEEILQAGVLPVEEDYKGPLEPDTVGSNNSAAPQRVQQFGVEHRHD